VDRGLGRLGGKVQAGLHCQSLVRLIESIWKLQSAVKSSGTCSRVTSRIIYIHASIIGPNVDRYYTP